MTQRWAAFQVFAQTEDDIQKAQSTFANVRAALQHPEGS
jgi:hypothetical protein